MLRHMPALLPGVLSLLLSVSLTAQAQESDSFISGASPLSTRKLSATQSCHVYAGYVVRVTADTSMAGSHLSVFSFAPGADVAKTCGLQASQAAFNLRNDNANWLFGLSGKYLFVDSGTGTGTRGLRVFDIKQGKAVYSTDYYDSTPVVLEQGRYLSLDKYLQIQEGPMSAVEKELCPESVKENTTIFGWVKGARLDLSTLKETPIGNLKCKPMLMG